MDSQKYSAVYDISGRGDVPVYTGIGGFERCVEYCRRLKGKSSDIILRIFTLADDRRCMIMMVDGMCEKDTIEQSIILAARRLSEHSDINKFRAEDGTLQQFGITDVAEESSLSHGYITALTGDVLCVIEGAERAYIFGYRKAPARSISPSPVEGAVQGPHEAFTENIRTNTALLRRRVSDPNMVIEHIKLGERSHTTIAVCYILGLTDPALISQTLSRVKSISIDIINDSGELEQLIEDAPHSVFPQVDRSELPDVAAGELCRGKIAIIVSGSPCVLLVPAAISDFMHVAEDDYQRWSYASFVKLLRWISLLIAVTGSALYVAVISYHPGLMPSDMLIISAVNRASVPFSALTEVLILEFSLELLREASIRMPQGISGTLSIVGGLIIGDAAISAGLISPLLVIIVGLANLASFTIPSYSLASSLRLVKYALLFCAALLGLFGLVCGLVATLSLLVSTKSFGVDLTTPFAPMNSHGALEGLLEMPVRKRALRPSFLHTLDRKRMKEE